MRGPADREAQTRDQDARQQQFGSPPCEARVDQLELQLADRDENAAQTETTA